MQAIQACRPAGYHQILCKVLRVRTYTQQLNRARFHVQEIFLTNVHRLKICHVRQEHATLDDAVQRRPARLQDGLDVLEHLAGLRGNAAFGELAGGRVNARLPGGENEIARLDALRVRADGLGRFISGDGFAYGCWIRFGAAKLEWTGHGNLLGSRITNDESGAHCTANRQVNKSKSQVAHHFSKRIVTGPSL